ncbi:hypothetical protein [Hanstruepera ponticola]|uniref:hypothetical protein n=1 Tax=Hanstruepera ponticola TaxID=2042995 RepID=UPI0017834DDE|nr:hypothetical protein [Hanstruepera ponticola]
MNSLNELGQITATLSFVIGTSLLAFFLYYGESSFIIEFGLVFIIVVFTVNIVLLSVLIGSAILNPKHRLKLIKTCAIMLLNIPIVIFYICVLL